MAGWLAVWLDGGQPLADHRWRTCLGDVVPRDETAGSAFACNAAIAAWRRHTGEFNQSGCILSPGSGSKVAWVGVEVGQRRQELPEAPELLGKHNPSDQELASINGAFAAAVLTESGQLRLFTDRYRHYPVYLYQGQGWGVACTDMRGVIPWLPKPQFDLQAADLFLRTGELLDGMTLLAGVELLPPAACVSIDACTITRRRYWHMEFKPDPTLKLGDCVPELADRLRTAVASIEALTPRLGITLSGGLDSRLLLGLCREPERVPSFTWGRPGCRDITCARDFAQRVGSPHRVRHWEPSAFVDLWNEGVAATAGSFGIADMFMLPFVDLVAQHCDVVLNGLAGDALLGGNFLKYSWFGMGIGELADTSWRWRVSPAQEVAVDHVLTGVPSHCARDIWKDSICAAPGSRGVEQLNAWLFENRVFRFTNAGTSLLRNGVESYAPFFDNRVVDFLLQVSLEHKSKHRLYLSVLNRACPVAGEIRWQRTGLPPRCGFTANLAAMAFHRILARAGKLVGIDPFPRLAVANVAAWFRNEWKAAAADILLSPRTLDRGVVRPEGVRDIWNEHQAGADHARLLGNLVALELFSRMSLDRSFPTMEPMRCTA